MTTQHDLHRHIVEAAQLAPSVHNTQPWRFTSDIGGLDLWADPGRRLPVLDPDGRQLHLSCGAALLNARVAARALGLDADVQLLPDSGDPTHLARLSLTAGRPATTQEQALAEAMLRRHTQREAFEERPLPDALLDRLRMAAEREGAVLRPVTDPADLIELEVLLALADRAEEADPAYRAEVATWVRPTTDEDGIPAGALPRDAERVSSLRLRDFQVRDRAESAGSPAADMEPPVAERPAVVVLLSADDTPVSWLQAGQALGAVLLGAAEEGVLAQPLGQVTDLPVFRRRLAAVLGLLGTAQLALRMGYSTAVASTARRDVDDVLDARGRDTGG